MDFKRIDNTIINTNQEDTNKNIKQRINEIDDMIDIERNKIKKIDMMQQDIATLNQHLNKCIDLLSKSVKGPTTQNVFNDMYETSRSIYVNLSSTLDEVSVSSIKTINRFSKQKEELIEERKKDIGENDASSSS